MHCSGSSGERGHGWTSQFFKGTKQTTRANAYTRNIVYEELLLADDETPTVRAGGGEGQEGGAAALDDDAASRAQDDDAVLQAQDSAVHAARAVRVFSLNAEAEIEFAGPRQDGGMTFFRRPGTGAGGRRVTRIAWDEGSGRMVLSEHNVMQRMKPDAFQQVRELAERGFGFPSSGSSIRESSLGATERRI